jgi:hypothetical protein
LAKKEKVYVKIPAMETGEITVKLNNRNYFPLKTKLFVRNLIKEKKIVIKEAVDTLFTLDTAMITNKGLIEELTGLPLIDHLIHQQNFINLEALENVGPGNS